MNSLTIIGNLTKDPETRTTQAGKTVCSFTVAVNKRQNGENQAEYFRVSAWEGQAKVCAQYLSKGRKVAVVGPVSYSTYVGNDGSTRVQLEVTARDVEFLSPKSESGGGFTQVEVDDNPFA